MVKVRQYDIFIVNLDPTVGHEIKKSRPCVIISPDEMNDHIGTVIVAPLTSTGKNYPTRVRLVVQGREGWIVLDQIRTVDKIRLTAKIGALEVATVATVKDIIRQMLVE
jgi:mRNA interferase MazF